MATLDELAMLFKVLSHPQRLRILQLLNDGERCVCEIVQALGLRQAYVSQQLILLRQAGLICFRKEGWNVYYRVACPEVQMLLQMAQAVHDRLGECALFSPDDLNLTG